MWTVIFVTNECEMVNIIKKNLENESLKVRIKKRSSEDSDQETFEILVPAAEVPLALAQVG